MKELSIEEKAKRYDKAVEIAKNIYGASECKDILCTLETIFPELKESEDERIRKAIKYGVKYLESEIGWDFVNDVDILDIYAWLEKQGEQKPTDKVEHKFKVGDWITDGNITIQIEAIKNDCYLYCGDCVLYSTKTADKVYHLWTIKDARPGDIITWKGSMFMFRGIGNKERSDVVDYYCDLIHDVLGYEFKIQFGGHHWGFLPSSLYDYEPANKEERELFFHKMNEAGYEWDSEKLKLKKISKR